MDENKYPYGNNPNKKSDSFDVDEIIKQSISKKISQQKEKEIQSNSGFGADNSPTISTNSVRRQAVSPNQVRRAANRNMNERKKQNASIMSYGVLKGLVFAVGIIIISAILSYVILSSAGDLMGLFKNEFIVEVEIPQNTTLSQITSILKDNGIISQPLTFKFYTAFKEKNLEFMEGTYRFNGNMSYDEIITVLKNSVRSDETVKITIPEGFTAREIAQRLEENRVCQASAFMKSLAETDFPYDFISEIPANGNRYLKLEGYLFPDTYDFFVGENPDSVIKKFLKNFQRKMNSDIKTRMEEVGMTMDEMVVLASVVQGEAGVQEEMNRVASVFKNRIKNSGTYPKLESDATRDYINDFVTPYVTAEENAKYAAAYNTYKCDGLPAGAVSNPGLEAIKAVLYPESTSYYYFVTDEDGNFYYATNITAHEANVQKARAVGTAQGTSTEGE